MLDWLREKIFPGFKRKNVTVDWWSGRQTADLGQVLQTAAAKRLLRREEAELIASRDIEG